MKNIHKLAAIDIGSNAVRLLITSIRINKSETKFKKISLVRVPLRLGEDVFSKGKISDKKLKKLQKRENFIEYGSIKKLLCNFTSRRIWEQNGCYFKKNS